MNDKFLFTITKLPQENLVASGIAQSYEEAKEEAKNHAMLYAHDFDVRLIVFRVSYESVFSAEITKR